MSNEKRPIDEPGGCLGFLSSLGELGLWAIIGLLLLAALFGPGLASFNEHIAPLDQVGRDEIRVIGR